MDWIIIMKTYIVVEHLNIFNIIELLILDISNKKWLDSIIK